VVFLQERVVQALGEKLDNDTLQTFTLAEQLSSDLTDLNIRIEGTDRSDPGHMTSLSVLQSWEGSFSGCM